MLHNLKFVELYIYIYITFLPPPLHLIRPGGGSTPCTPPPPRHNTDIMSKYLLTMTGTF